MPQRSRDKYLPGLSYGMSGGPMSIAWREGLNRPAPPNRRVTALCIQCHEATKIWDYDKQEEFPITSYYWRCICPPVPHVPHPVSASELPNWEW